jgi:hypothetical protein
MGWADRNLRWQQPLPLVRHRQKLIDMAEGGDLPVIKEAGPIGR